MIKYYYREDVIHDHPTRLLLKADPDKTFSHMGVLWCRAKERFLSDPEWGNNTWYLCEIAIGELRHSYKEISETEAAILLME